MKTQMSRFQIHDDLTAPEGSAPVLRGVLAAGGQLPNFLGVLAGSPAALRAYARFRAELRHGAPARWPRSNGSRWRSPSITAPSRASTCTAVPRGAPGSASTRSRWRASSTAATRARRRCCATCSALVPEPGGPPMHLHEEAREAGWSDEEILEAIAYAALETLTAMINLAGDVPLDGSAEESRTLRAA